MAWRFQRRIRLASGIHLNLGKRGASWSFGGAPYTVNVGRRGVYRTFSIPGTGISHRSRIGGSQKVGGQRPSRAPPIYEQGGADPTWEASLGLTSQEISDDQVTADINKRAAKTPAWPFVLVGLLLFAAKLPLLLLLTPLTYFVFQWDLKRRTTEIIYESNAETTALLKNLEAAFQPLVACAALWLVQTSHDTNDWKRNAGATSLVGRKPAQIGSKPPQFIATNIPVRSIRSGNTGLYFFPDKVLAVSGKKFVSIPNEQLTVHVNWTKFIETSTVPRDSEIIDYTWRFVNKDGGPDRRFNNNQQIPVVAYGEVRFAARGLDWLLQTSAKSAAYGFGEVVLMSQGRQRQAPPPPNRPPPPNHQGGHQNPPPPNSSPPPRRPAPRPSAWDAHAVLGVKPGAPAAAVAEAYRAKVKMYHPDRVASLAPEYKVIAESKMKEINRAYAELTRQ